MENLTVLRSACSSNMSFVKQLKQNELHLSELILCTSYLDEHYSPTIKQRIFHFLHNHFEIVKCKHCGNPSAWNKFDAANYESFYYPSKNYQEYCDRKDCVDAKNSAKIKKQWKKLGISNISQLAKWKETKVKNCLEQYGTEWYNQTEEYKSKLKENSLKKYGVEHPTQLENTQEKKRISNIKKYGAKYATQNDDIKKKIVQTNILKFGFESPMQSTLVQNKVIETNLKRYGKRWYTETDEFKEKSLETYNKKGVNHCSQISGTIEKRCRAGYKWKEYVFPSGRKIKIQGYENKAIDILLGAFDEEDIVTENIEIEKYVGKIFYESGGKMHRYFPDIYIKSTHTIIEVKSEWTFQNQKKINLLKEQSAKKSANFEFMIIEK